VPSFDCRAVPFAQSLDETTLKKIAEVTDAQYFQREHRTDLRTVYENLTTQLVVRNEKTELTAYATLPPRSLRCRRSLLAPLVSNRLP